MSDLLYNAPKPLSLDGNVSENFRRWRQRYNIYMEATEKSSKSKAQRACILLHLMGEDAIEIFNTFDLTDEERTDPDKILGKFKEYCDPRKNVVYERYIFFSRDQHEGENIDHFITDLKKLSLNCEFGDLQEDLIRDRIVCGTTSSTLKQRMLRDNDLTLQKAIALAQAEEQTKNQLKAMESKGDSSKVDVLRTNKQKQRQDQKQKSPGKTQRSSGTGNTQMINNCQRCGKSHKVRECPAYQKKCIKCGRMNHFAKLCRNQYQYQSKNYNRRTINAVKDYDEKSDEETIWIGTLETRRDPTNSWKINVTIGDEKQIKMKVDTGAEADVIPLTIWNQIKGQNDLEKSKIKLKNYDGKDIKCTGVVTTKLSVGKKETQTKIYVAENSREAVLGLKSSLALGLVSPGENGATLEVNVITQATLTETYKDVFSGLGTYQEEYHITLSDNAEPIICQPRRIPPILHKPLKEKLDAMVRDGVIEQVDQPTKWVNNIVVVKKSDGSLRICLDPRHMNKFIERELFEIPTFEQIATNLGNKKYFTILDQKESYWQVKLDAESSLLTTFNTPFGRFKFLRMPFGISSASEVLQKRAFQTFGDIEGVHCLSDDMLIAAETEKEHDRILEKVMKRARRENVKFNPKKIQLKKNKVKYMGRIVSGDGITPDASKVKAITEMPAPQDVKGVQRLLGMMNFLSPFIPNMSTLTAPLRELLKKDVQWNWTHEHTQALKKVKTILGGMPVLKIFDSKKKTIIQCDASSKGLGACLLQDSQPIAYASRSLTETEQNYAQIEKELLAIVFAAEHFHQFIYGQAIIVESDHKPLETIFKKPLHKASPRLQLMMLRLLRYNLSVQYTAGSKLLIADTLSRAYLTKETEKQKEFDEDTLRIHTTTTVIPATQEKLRAIRNDIRNDQILSKVLQYVKNDRWPDKCQMMHKEIQQLRNMKDQIYQENDILFLDDRMIIPQAQRKEILEQLHRGHLGIEKSKRRARQSLFWMNMNADIERKIKLCDTCQKFQNKNQKEPMISHDVPNNVWEKIGVDIFEFEGKDYLILVDYFSKYPEICRLDGKSAGNVIKAMKPIFARHGIPMEIIADNNPFNSYEMSQFAKDWNIQITNSSPRHPQSNGQVERFVQIVKRILMKCKNDGTDPNIGLLMYRNTPITGLENSPAQLLMGRSLRDLISLVPQKRSIKFDDAHRSLVQNQKRAKYYFDKGTRQRPDFKVGDPIRMRRDGRWWERGVISEKAETPRSFHITTENGLTLRRNSKAIQPSTHHPIIHREVDINEESMNQRQPTEQVNAPHDAHGHKRPKRRHSLSSSPGVEPNVVPDCNHQSRTQHVTKSGRVVKKPNKLTL